jgi:HD domain
MKGLPFAARAFVGVVVAAACVVLGLAFGHPMNIEWVVVLTVMYAAHETRMPSVSGSNVYLGLGFPIGLASYIILGPWGAAFVGAGAVLVVEHTLVKRIFNAAQFSLCAFAAGQAYVFFGGHVGHLAASDFPQVLFPVLVADLVHCAVNGLLLMGVVSLAEKVSPKQVLVGSLLKSVPGYLGYGLFGLLMAVLWVGVDIGVLSALLVLMPLAVARWAFSQYSAEQQAYESTIHALVQAVETKDRYTRGHSERVSRASVMIARFIGMREDRLNALRYAGILHDVGKLGVPTKLLQKTDRLSEEEFAAIKLHPVRGLEMLSDIEFLDEAFKGILHHHERLDGRGYPMGLAGAQIPEFARVIAVADAFDSMTSTRSYRHARSVEDAITELERCKGSQFDPRMVAALIASLVKEPWVASGVDDAAERIEASQSISVATVDHDDPTFSVAFRDDTP